MTQLEHKRLTKELENTKSVDVEISESIFVDDLRYIKIYAKERLLEWEYKQNRQVRS